MAFALLKLPPELLDHILSFLSIRDLLHCGQTCHRLKPITDASLHTLDLRIHTNRISISLSELLATQCIQPTKTSSAFSAFQQQPPAPPPRKAASKLEKSARRDSLGEDLFTSGDEREVDRHPSHTPPRVRSPSTIHHPYSATLLIPSADSLPYHILHIFQHTLTSSILIRHSPTLTTLSLTLWTLALPLAHILATSLPALRNLAIRVETYPAASPIPRSHRRAQIAEEKQAWDVLCAHARDTWGPRLRALRLEGGQVTTAQLASLLGRNRGICRELWVVRCAGVKGGEFWPWVAREWVGTKGLKVLGVVGCGGEVDDEVLEGIAGMSVELQFLSLQSCHGPRANDVKRMNSTTWHIPELVAPTAGTDSGDVDGDSNAAKDSEADGTGVIEVDPAYACANRAVAVV